MARRAPRRNARALSHIGRLGQGDEEPRVERRARRPAHARPPHRGAAHLAVAQPAEERLDQRVAGGEGVVLLVLDRHLAPERAQHGAVLRQIESGQRVDFKLGPDVERHFAGQHVDRGVHLEADALGRLDGDIFEARLEERRHRPQRRRRVRSGGNARAQAARAAIGQRAHRREIAAAQIEQRIVRAGHLGARRRHARSQLARDALPLRRIVGGARAEGGQVGLDRLEDGVEPAHRFGEHAHAGVEHVEHVRRQRALGAKGVDAHLARLADAVDAADALLDGRRAPRQIVVHQHVAVLEVAPLAAQLRAEHHARAFGIAKARHQLVALGGGQIAGVRQGLDAFLGQGGAQVLDGLARLGKNQHLLAGELSFDQRAERFQLRVLPLGAQSLSARDELF